MVEFVGRKDNRVKVRGFTVEIETVEAAMERLPGVTRAAVRTMLDDDGEARLIGYVETDADPSAAAPELRRRLAGQLPDYMIPFRLLPLRRMPLGPTGKVRLTALPDPGSLRPELENPYRAPRTAIERCVAEIWSSVLEIQPIGIDDNFFDLGGHSLSAGRIIARIHDQLSVDIPLRIMFDAPTVALLAGHVAAQEAAAANGSFEEKDLPD